MSLIRMHQVPQFSLQLSEIHTSVSYGCFEVIRKLLNKFGCCLLEQATSRWLLAGWMISSIRHEEYTRNFSNMKHRKGP